MPNKRSAHKKSVTISISLSLVIKIDAVAKLTNRSRTYVIEHFIRSQINDKNDDLNVDFQVIKAAQGISLN